MKTTKAKATKATTTTKPKARKATTKATRKQASAVTDLVVDSGKTLRLATADATLAIRRTDSGVIVRIDYADARWREILI